jgi:hypothetical protein
VLYVPHGNVHLCSVVIYGFAKQFYIQYFIFIDQEKMLVRNVEPPIAITHYAFAKHFYLENNFTFKKMMAIVSEAKNIRANIHLIKIKKRSFRKPCIFFKEGSRVEWPLESHCERIVITIAHIIIIIVIIIILTALV